MNVHFDGDNHGVMIDTISGGTVYIGRDGVKVEREHMPNCEHDAMYGAALMQVLVGQRLVAGETTTEQFLWAMGFGTPMPQNARPLQWMGTKQLMREMLTGLYAEPLQRGAMTMADLDRQLQSCVVDREGKPMVLAKPKAIPSMESDALAHFFATR